MKHTYQSSIDFINKLNFEYVKTYSYRRGEEYELWKKNMLKEHEQLSRRRNPTLEETNLLNELNERLRDLSYLLRKDGKFHPFSKHTHTFSVDSKEVDRIKEILSAKIVEEPNFMCMPDYRDGIVFYDKNDGIVAALNICLSCGYMEVAPLSYIKADTLSYNQLKKFFLELGHEVEEPDHFFIYYEQK